MGSAAGESRIGAAPGRLPVELSSFVGRRRELAAIDGELGRTRLLTLTGSGGCGKTRLATRAAGAAAGRFEDGALWVDLAAVAEEAGVGQALAEALGVRPLPGQSALEAAVGALRERRALVVVDNCEHLIGPAAAAVEAILREAPDCAVLATSRAPLAVPGETTWRVPSLSLPAAVEPESPAELERSDAVGLFVERALQVRPDFTVDDANAVAISRLCRELDGIPLALELAAARLRMMEVGEIADALDDRFALLGGSRSALPRQRTLHASIAWSHDLLGDPERLLFRRLAVFEGGWDREAMPAACAGDGLTDGRLLDLLTALVDKSLVLPEGSGGRSRYRMLETIHQFARDRLEEAGEAERLRERHGAWFLALAERAAPKLERAEQNAWLARLDADAANLLAATERATASDPERALRLCAALTLFWKLRGRYAEAEAAFAGALASGAAADVALRARASWGRAYIGAYSGDYEMAIASAEAALEPGAQAGDTSTRARALDVLGTIRLLPDPVGAAATERQAQELALEAGDEWCWVDATQIRSYAQLALGRLEEAMATMEECAPTIAAIGSGEFDSWRHFLRGAVSHQRAELDDAETSFRRGIETAEAVGEPASAAISAAYLALLMLQRGRPERGEEMLEPRLRATIAAGAGLAVPHLRFAGAALLGGRDPEAAHAQLALLLEETGALDAQLAPQLLAWLGSLELSLGRTGEAAARAAALRAAAARLEDDPGTGAQASHLEGLCVLADGEPAAAERLIQEALGQRLEGGLALEVPDSLDTLARCAAARGEAERAARLLGAATRLRDDAGSARWRPDAAAAAELERRLRSEGHEAAFAEVRALPPAEALAWARGNRGRRGRPAGGWDSLTPTERRVAQLAATGLTNPQIAARMFIAAGTVKVHLSRVYAKLGVANRVELAARAGSRTEVGGAGQPSPGA